MNHSAGENYYDHKDVLPVLGSEEVSVLAHQARALGHLYASSSLLINDHP